MSTAPPATGADDWRRFARRDWCRLHLLLAAGDAPGADMLLQQALEEYLKAYLLQRGWPLRKTHELDRLLDAAVTYAPSLAPFRPLCERVSGYYLVERHPGGGDGAYRLKSKVTGGVAARRAAMGSSHTATHNRSTLKAALSGKAHLVGWPGRTLCVRRR